MQVVFINECKSCKINNQMLFSVMFLFSKGKDKLAYDIYDIYQFCTVKQFSGNLAP